MYEETMVREAHDRIETIRHEAELARLAEAAAAPHDIPFARARREVAAVLHKIALAVDPSGEPEGAYRAGGLR